MCLLPPSVIIALMMEGASTSETSVNLYQSKRRSNPEFSHLHTRRRENLKSDVMSNTYPGRIYLTMPTYIVLLLCS
jgi:hypothetical protein